MEDAIPNAAWYYLLVIHANAYGSKAASHLASSTLIKPNTLIFIIMYAGWNNEPNIGDIDYLSIIHKPFMFETSSSVPPSFTKSLSSFYLSTNKFSTFSSSTNLWYLSLLIIWYDMMIILYKWEAIIIKNWIYKNKID